MGGAVLGEARGRRVCRLPEPTRTPQAAADVQGGQLGPFRGKGLTGAKSPERMASLWLGGKATAARRIAFVRSSRTRASNRYTGSGPEQAGGDPELGEQGRGRHFQRLDLTPSAVPAAEPEDAVTPDVLERMRVVLGPVSSISSYRCEDHPIEAARPTPGQLAFGP